VKKCGMCSKLKSESEYHKNKSVPDGLQRRCKQCRREHYATRGREWAPAKDVADKSAANVLPKLDTAIYARRVLVTSAVNATPAHAGFWAALKQCAAHYEAQLLVVPIRYKNPTSVFQDPELGVDWWAPELAEYLVTTRIPLNKNLVLAADVKVQPTAGDALNGFDSLTGGESCIVAHPRIALRAVPVPSGKLPKLLVSTGACTQPNYTDSKAGALGNFHHTLGAALVELEDDGKTFHLRQINAHDDGSFIDLACEFTPDGVNPAPPLAAMVCGDSHAAVCDALVVSTGYALARELRAQNVVLHDVHDGQSTNHHESKNPFAQIALFREGRRDVAAEILKTFEFLRMTAAKTRAKVHVVASNHNDFLDRWLRTHDWRDDPQNAKMFLRAALSVAESAGAENGVPAYDSFLPSAWAGVGFKELVTWLKRGESFMVAGVELGLHGDVGPNGSRGSLKNLSRLGVKVVTGHSHTPGIHNGHYQVGTNSRLNLGYNTGPSSWMHTNCLVYASGKRTLVHCIDGKWHLPDTLNLAPRP
jgi:hypothetical protein